VYVDEGVQTPDGSEFAVEAYRADKPGPGRTPSVANFLLSLFDGSRRQWKVRVRPWPGKMFGDGEWVVVVDSQERATRTCDELQCLLEAGAWKPSDGEPPGISTMG
jgi:hypothetical protein